MSHVLAVVEDLMFASRIREAAGAVEVRTARDLAGLERALGEAPRLVLLDLDARRLPAREALALLRARPELAGAPIVGFFSHVHAGAARDAQEAGCSKVLPRSAFDQQLPALIAEAAGEARSG